MIKNQKDLRTDVVNTVILGALVIIKIWKGTITYQLE